MERPRRAIQISNGVGAESFWTLVWMGLLGPVLDALDDGNVLLAETRTRRCMTKRQLPPMRRASCQQAPGLRPTGAKPHGHGAPRAAATSGGSCSPSRIATATIFGISRGSSWTSASMSVKNRLAPIRVLVGRRATALRAVQDEHLVGAVGVLAAVQRPDRVANDVKRRD